MEHMSTSMIWTLGHMHYEQDFHWLKCELDDKRWFPSHWVMCKASWWRSGPNNCVWLTSCGWGLHNGPLAHSHIYTYKTYFHWIKSKDISVTNSSLQKWLVEKVNQFLDHPKYIQGDYLSSIFAHFVEGANVFVCSVRLEFACPFVHFPKT